MIEALRRITTEFLLWRPDDHSIANGPPTLVIGTLVAGNPVSLAGIARVDLQRDPGNPDVWSLAAAQAGLPDGVYHYWFEVDSAGGARKLVTDPLARTVDWRVLDPDAAAFPPADAEPAAVIGIRNGILGWVDASGDMPQWGADDAALAALPGNASLVIYELGARWVRRGGDPEFGIGTFQDVRALVDPTVGTADFLDEAILQPGNAYLTELGVNAIELLPPADSRQDREWGYGTTNYLAPDYDLGFPGRNSSSTASRDLVDLIAACHRGGVRFLYDAVMGFTLRNPYLSLNPAEFFLDPPDRAAWGGDRWSYARYTDAWDPLDGQRRSLSPAGALMLTHLGRWIQDLHIDGIRIDSVKTVDNDDFVAAVTRLTRGWFQQRQQAIMPGADPAAINGRYLVIGEQLDEPASLLDTGAVDALWHDKFRVRIRALLAGESDNGDVDRADTVWRMLDPRTQQGYRAGTQAVNYLGSHDVEGPRQERLHDFLAAIGATDGDDMRRRILLAFAALLTAVGIPMILAGDEFGDASALSTHNPDKQLQSVAWSSLDDQWRKDLFHQVSRLVRLRTSSPALAGDDIAVIHADLTPGRCVVAWQRGWGTAVVVVVANFSGWGSDVGDPNAEYRIPRWPAAPAGFTWYEVTSDTTVRPEWVARQPLYPWEARVYALR